MSDVDASTIAPWLQTGGLLAFATFVSIELRSMRPVLNGCRELLAALLERERMRAEQRQQLIQLRARESAAPPMRREAERWDEDVTGQVDEPAPPKPKRRTSPFGHPIGQRAPTKGGKDS